jgi:hypothetical protein
VQSAVPSLTDIVVAGKGAVASNHMSAVDSGSIEVTKDGASGMFKGYPLFV